MRKIFGIVSAIVTILLALLLFSLLPHVILVEDLTESGSGLELGEWQISAGIYLTAVVLFAIMTVSAFRLRFSTGLTIVSWLTFGLLAAVVWFLHSAKSRIGVINQYGHGLTYDAWQASVIPWSVALVLVGLCAVSSLIHWRLSKAAEAEETRDNS